MKLSQHLKFSKFLIESKSPGSIYRVMDIEELVHLLRDKEWELTDNKFENIDIDDNVMDDSQENIKKLQSSLVYKKNKEYPYSRSFARSLRPGLIQNHFDSDTSVIVEFDKEALSNLRNTQITAIDYQPYGRAHKNNEMEDRLYSKSKSIKLPPKYNLSNLIKTIYFSEDLAYELSGDIKVMKNKLGLDIKIIPWMEDYSKLNLAMMKRL
jgi:hypothetical protein